MTAEERRLGWDERHRAGDFEGEGPNPTLVAAAAPLATGRALELACGSGTNAVWLASRGWQTTAVDWSAVALENGRAKAAAAGVRSTGSSKTCSSGRPRSNRSIWWPSSTCTFRPKSASRSIAPPRPRSPGVGD